MSTLRISISFEHEPIELDILSDKLTWSNLITFIDSMHAIETPLTLYYRKDTEIETIQTQDQLTQLLIPNIQGLRFYAQKELVAKPVYILPGPNAFATLAQFVEENKAIIASSHRLARSVGKLAFFIAQDTTKGKFEHEFEMLENLVTRKSKRHETKQAEETSEEQQEEDPRETLFGRRDGCHFGGHHFGGRGGGYRGHGGRSGPFDSFDRPFFGGRPNGHHFGGCGGGYGGHGDRGGPFDSFDGPFFGGRGGPFSRGSTPFGGRDKQGRSTSSLDTEELDPSGELEGFGKHARGVHGRGRFNPFSKQGKRGKLGHCGKFDSFSKDSFTKDKKFARKMYLLKKLQRSHGFMKNDNHLHFA